MGQVMRDPGRIDRIISLLGALWRGQPDTRLGQLVDNLAIRAGGRDVYFIEDDVLERAIREALRDF